MQQASSEPTRTGYVIAGIIFAFGIIGAIALAVVFILGLFGLGDDLERIVAPGSSELELSDTGTYTIYYEYRSTVDGVDYDGEQVTPSLDISVIRVDDGQDIQVDPNLISTNYSLTNHAGRAIRTFDVDEPGRYEISAEYAAEQDGPPFVLAVGQGVIRSILMSIGSFFAAGAVFCIATLLAIVIAGITLIRRSRAEQRTAGTNAPPVP